MEERREEMILPCKMAFDLAFGRLAVVMIMFWIRFFGFGKLRAYGFQ